MIAEAYDATRAAAEPPPGDPAPLHTLTTKQRRTLIIVGRYTKATGEACPVRVLARQLRVHHSTAQQQLSVLHRKGWVRAPSGSAMLTRDVEEDVDGPA